MAKKNVTYVPASLVEELIAASGIHCVEKAGWLKVGRFGNSGPRLYVPRLKSVGRIDLVGLDDCPGARPLGGESFGSVTAQLDMSRSQDEILEDLALILGELATRPELPPRVRGPRTAKAVESTTTPEAQLARIALIRQVAAQHGVPVSASSPACNDEE